MNSGTPSGLKAKLLRLLSFATPPSAAPGDLWYDQALKVVRFSDGTNSQVLEPIIEQATRIDIVGHSGQAEGGAKLLDYGSAHKFAQFSPAQFNNLAWGAATVVSPGAVPASNLTVGSQQAGWEWILNKCPNTERTCEFDSTGTITKGVNTTLTSGTAAGLAVGTSIAVGSSAGFAAAFADQQSVAVPCLILGANPELVYFSSSADSTHLMNYRIFALQHFAGDPIVAVPDAWMPSRQLVTLEYDWNDLSMMGMTTWQTAFPHAYRSVIARLRECAFFGIDTVLHTDTSGAWTKAALTSGFRYKSVTAASAVQTITTPILNAGQSIVLYFLTAAVGDGASINISVNSGANIAFDTRNINGFDYVNGTGTRAANGQQMLSCKVLRPADGIISGVNTITITTVTYQNTFFYAGFGVIPAEPPPIIAALPYRLVNYAIYFGAPKYTPVDADQATMAATISSLLAEWDSLIIPLTTLDGILNGNASYFAGDGVHLNDAGHAERAVEFIKLMRSTFVPIRTMMLPTPRTGKNWYYVQPNGGSGTTFNANWANVSGVTPAGFYKDIITGVVYLQGEVFCSSTTQAINTVIFTLPPGHRPANQKLLVSASEGGPIIMTVYTNGDVAVAGTEGVGSTDGLVSFDSLMFMTEK